MNEPQDPGRDELASWQEAWQEPAAGLAGPLDEEVARVKRCSRRFGRSLVAVTIGELLTSTGALAFAAYHMAQKPSPWRYAFLGLVFLLVGTAQVFALLNRRGTWRPRNETTHAFVELEWLRTQRQLRTIRWCLPFFAFEMVSLAGLRLGELASDPARAGRVSEIAGRFALYGGLCLVLIALATWRWHWKVRRKRKELEPLRAAFAPPADAGQRAP